MVFLPRKHPYKPKAYGGITATAWAQQEDQTLHVIPSHAPNIMYAPPSLFIWAHVLQWFMMCVGVLTQWLLGKPPFTQLIRLLPLLAPAEHHLWPVTPCSRGSLEVSGDIDQTPLHSSITVCDLSGSDRRVCVCVCALCTSVFSVLDPFQIRNISMAHANIPVQS